MFACLDKEPILIREQFNQHPLFMISSIKFLQHYIQFSMLNILSRQQSNASLGLRYIVPLEWWQNFLAHNSQRQNSNDLIITDPLKIENFIETIQPTEKEAFIRLVGQKVNFLQIDNLILNPKLKTATKWKAVSGEFLELLKRKFGFSFSLPLISFQNIKKQQNESFSVDQEKQFKIVKLLLCSFTQNHLFYGYIDEKVNKKKFIEEIISFLDYYSTKNTKVTFLETNEFRNYKFQDLDKEFHRNQQLIMIHGLQRFDQKVQQECAFKFEAQQFFIPPFESPRMTRAQRNGDQMTMADQDSQTMSEHTMSTGAQTPFTFGFEDQDWDSFRPYHKYALFGERLEEQIEHMKEYARQAIYTDIIQVPFYKEQIMISELNKLADDIEQNIEKKKIYQKQIAKDAKEYLKDLKETHHNLHFKDKEVFAKESKEIFSNKTIESQQKIKEAFNPVVYYSSSNQNN